MLLHPFHWCFLVPMHSWQVYPYLVQGPRELLHLEMLSWYQLLVQTFHLPSRLLLLLLLVAAAPLRLLPLAQLPPYLLRMLQEFSVIDKLPS